MRPGFTQFAQAYSKTVQPGRLVIPARPGRAALLLSVQLVTGDPVYVIGNSPIDGIVINIDGDMGSVQMLAADFGETLSLDVWNGGTTSLQVVMSEHWTKPNGTCVCD